VAIDFSDRILIVNPTAYHLGRSIVFIALIAIAIGGISCFTGEILMPALAWVAAAVPAIAIGAILIASGVRKS
jgi:hypothetical protein